MKLPALLLAAATPLISVQAPAHGPNLGAFATAVPVTEVNVEKPTAEGCPIESPDGLSLFIASNRTGTLGGNDIWVADRTKIGEPFQPPRNIGEPINSSAADFCPTPAFGRSLFFVSDRA